MNDETDDAKAEPLKPIWLIQSIQLISTAPDIYRIAFRNKESGELVDADISL